tara:strand:+ start:483 stop:794 length:312 start_codon:yes stop_codon:yes gene_type:complete
MRNTNTNTNNNINNKNNKNMKSLKFTQLNILKIRNTYKTSTYLPYQLHQLPKWFNKYNTEHLSIKGYCYILLEDHYENSPYFNLNNFKSSLSYNKDLGYKNKR